MDSLVLMKRIGNLIPLVSLAMLIVMHGLTQVEIIGTGKRRYVFIQLLEREDLLPHVNLDVNCRMPQKERDTRMYPMEICSLLMDKSMQHLEADW